MDILKLCKKVMGYREVEDIPFIYVYTIIICVIEAISSGECFYDMECDHGIYTDESKSK